ncbi:ATP-binding cassette domain-containing protein [Halogeometricum borinquense]|uniref:ATP-binding cassette domain-containing protein n=1 Tax=Halogeometricum borinquense TaxID=60847 RepID=UPI00341B72F1
MDGLHRCFGAVTAVHDLSLTVDTGEIFGFLGSNGAGKSTTISLILGFLRPTSGTVRVLGHDVTQEPVTVRSKIGLLPKNLLLPEPQRS